MVYVALQVLLCHSINSVYYNILYDLGRNEFEQVLNDYYEALKSENDLLTIGLKIQ